jgi:hypothetical protein
MWNPNAAFTTRMHTVRRTVLTTATAVNRKIEKKFSDVVPMVCRLDEREDSENYYLQAHFYYWALVSWLKETEDFQQGHLINSSKKAALTIYAIAAYREQLFSFDDLWCDKRCDKAFFYRLGVELIQLFRGEILDPSVWANPSGPPEYELSESEAQNLLGLILEVPSINDPLGEVRYVNSACVRGLCGLIEGIRRYSNENGFRKTTPPPSDVPLTSMEESFDHAHLLPSIKPYFLRTADE